MKHNLKDESRAKGKEDEERENNVDQAVESSDEEQQPEEGRKKKQRTGFRDRKVFLFIQQIILAKF